MGTLYHTRGFLKGLAVPPLRHLRDWLRDPAYRALHRFHRQLRGQPRHAPAGVHFEGRPIRICDAPSFLSAWDEIFVNRIYAIPPPAAIPTLVDVGANIGLAALFWKQSFGDFRYLGFEPDPAIAECCRENLRAWGVQGELVEAAVGPSDGEGQFVRDGADGGHIAGDASAGVVTTTVRCVRLSSRLPASIDLLKIDVEGAEADVIEDVAPCLQRVRALFVEWHSRSGRAGLGRAIERLESAGFDCFVQVASGPARPFTAVAPDGAMFSQHLNLYAVRP